MQDALSLYNTFAGVAVAYAAYLTYLAWKG